MEHASPRTIRALNPFVLLVHPWQRQIDQNINVHMILDQDRMTGPRVGKEIMENLLMLRYQVCIEENHRSGMKTISHWKPHRCDIDNMLVDCVEMPTATEIMHI